MEAKETPVTGLLFIPDVPGLELDRDVTALWRSILSKFIAPSCDSVGFSGIDSAAQLARLQCFADWQPPRLGEASCHFERDTPAAGRKAHDKTITLFRLDDEANDRLQLPMFHFWSVSNPPYPVDELTFFNGSEILLSAEPYEEGLLFCNLTLELQEKLRSADARILKHLNQSRNWSVTASVKLDSPERP
jgi:hypothetical protein